MQPIEIKLSLPKASEGKFHLDDYPQGIGVQPIPPAISPFDPGYDPLTLEGHLQQSAHLMSILKISMACWMIADESATRRKIAAARRHRVPIVTGGGPAPRPRCVYRLRPSMFSSDNEKLSCVA